MSRRIQLGIAFLSVAVLAGGAGLFGAQLVRSPAQEAADIAPPKPSRLTAPVTTGALNDTITFRATVDLGHPVELTPTATGVVTHVDVRRGETVRAGQVLLTVNDRPVFLLQGEVPFYRDLTQGTSGLDVARLQRSLGDAGYSTSDRLGDYGASTARAVERLYQDNGFEPQTTESSTEPADVPQDQVESSTSRTRKPSERPKTTQVLPLAELQLASTLPAQVSAVAAQIGTTDLTSAITLSSSAPVVTGKLNPLDADELHAGDRFRAADDDAALKFSGTIRRVGKPASDETDGYVSLVTMRPRRTLPISAAGVEVRVTVVPRASKATLIVPSAAVYSDGAGRTYVRLVQDKDERRITVTVTGEANGRVSLTAEPEPLEVGDQVVVGTT